MLPPSPHHRSLSSQSQLNVLGSRPHPSLVAQAQLALARIDSDLTERLAVIASGIAPDGIDAAQWNPLTAQEEVNGREEAEKEKLTHKSVVRLTEIHQMYQDLLKKQNSTILSKTLEVLSSFVERNLVDSEVGKDVAMLLLETAQKGSDKLDLSGRFLLSLPESFGELSNLTSLDLSSNRLKELPNSISSLHNLEVLDLHSNELSSLPDSTGLLHKLRVLRLSGNMLRALPEAIGGCSALVELIVDFNQLERLPPRIGCSFPFLQKLSVHSNKLSFLPPSICAMTSLRVMDIHFNNLMSLPTAIGNLTTLQKLNVSSNFSDFGGMLPNSIGDLVSLIELDLSFNQIRILPDSLGALENLQVLKLENNPLVIPPLEVAEHSMEAVKEYMAERWKLQLASGEEIILSRRKVGKCIVPTRVCVGMGLPWLVSSVLGKCSARSPRGYVEAGSLIDGSRQALQTSSDVK